MPGVILENLSGKKLFILVTLLCICQVICFLIGGLIAPKPSNAENVLGSKCYDELDSKSWYYIRGKGKCDSVNIYQDMYTVEQHANEVIFVFQLPSPRDNIVLDYSRWQQTLIGVLQFSMAYYPEFEMDPDVILTLDVKLGYRNANDAPDDWKLYSSSVIERHLHCSPSIRKPGYHYECSAIPLFELASLHHDYYLLNIRLPLKPNTNGNKKLGIVDDIWLVVINQNGGFTKVWLSLKSIFFPIIIGIMMWFWKRVHQLQRKPVLLEYMLLFLGASLTILNMPIELLTLYFEMPFMSLLQDVRQGLFYAALLSFWLVFAGEHLMIQDSHRSFKVYWKHLSAVVVGCISLFIFDVCEKGGQISNPFYSIWVTHLGTNIALSFIMLAGISASVYFIFLCYMIWQVFRNISIKRNALPNMSSMRRLHYEGIIYRFKFLMLTTLASAAMTIIGFILGHVSEGKWKWDENIQLEYISAFFTGVYGMWNIYIFGLIVLYSPSHKHWPSEQDLSNPITDNIEFSNLSVESNEISLLTKFAKKTAAD